MFSLPIPDVQHGKRMAILLVDEHAQTNPKSPWVSVPINDQDISEGYKDITFGQFSNAVNRAAHWLEQTIPPPENAFQCFAYVGPKDLRYPILAMAAGKVGLVMILPSPMMKPEAQLNILEKKECTVYIRDESMASVVDEVVARKPNVRILSAPDIKYLLQDKKAEPFVYAKTWEEGKDDPWLVFHTSGTTGHPKPITYTHKMMAIPDMAAKLAGDEETNIHHYAFKRWYTPLPMIHFVGMLMVLSMSTFVHSIIVLGPSGPPSPKTTIDILKFGKVDGAILVPAMIDALCRDPSGLAALRDLQYIHYAGAPLNVDTGKLLAPYTRLVTCIGSTEAGGYFLKLRDDREDWDYITFNSHAGAEFEPRTDGLHELVFVRKPECALQQIFLLYPHLDRFETNDLWVEHPTRKGLWKIMEKEIEWYELVQSALIGGHGKAKPVLLIELLPEAQDHKNKDDLAVSLVPFLEAANAKCHSSVQLSVEMLLIAKPSKPLVRTMKGSVARLPSLKLYEDEINAMYASLW